MLVCNAAMVFTDKGITGLIQEKTEEQFIELIQTHMVKVLPEWIRRTDPAFK